jgi:hypothetical protein
MKKLTKKQMGGPTEKNTVEDRMIQRKKMDALDKRIIARDSVNQRNSYTNERANKVVGKKKK